MNINWFPGHMAKTLKLLEQDLKLVDLIIEVLDARLPYSSRNPDIDHLKGGKSSIVIFNKMDLADPEITQKWLRWYNSKGIVCIPTDSKKGSGINKLIDAIKKIRDKSDKYTNQKLKGRIFRPARVMVAGIPNVGKSSLINRLIGKAAAITGDKPGVTKGRQWIRLNEEIELLDTPGVLPPKIENQHSALNLAYIGTIKDTLLDTVEIAQSLLKKLNCEYKENLIERYGQDLKNLQDENVILATIGKKRGFLLQGGIIDIKRTAAIVLDEFRAGMLGKISLERPIE
jgi:ribosome biogenesis GTPase A